MKDWRGTEIEVGDTIVYAVKESTWVAIHEAVVNRVGMKSPASGYGPDVPCVMAEWKRNNQGDTDRSMKRVALTTFENITVIDKAARPEPGEIVYPASVVRNVVPPMGLINR